MRDGDRTGVGERLPSAHPVATSARGTDRRAGFVVEGAEQGAQLCVVLRFRWWNEGFMSMFSRFWEGSLFLFLGRWYRGWEEKAPQPMEFELCSLHDTP